MWEGGKLERYARQSGLTNNRALIINAHGQPGFSGGPVLVDVGGEYQLIGVIVAGTRINGQLHHETICEDLRAVKSILP